jgi:membrane protease YdiL (CAAX protease family)
MPMLKLLPLLVLSLAVMAWFVRNDSAEYAAFKQLTGTADRQRCYAGWIVKSFGLFSGTTLFCLLILQRLHAFTQMPAEFLPLTARLRAIVPPSQIPDKALIAGVICGALIGGALLGVVLAKKLKIQPVTIGDIEPLMPRNTAETGWTTLLALNAGLSEEVFFRLLLPLLLAGLLHNALFAFALATVLFGLIHFYQGTAGIVLTALLGAGLACVYLWTGNVWIAITVHAGIDLLGLVVRPTATRMLSRAPAQITEHDKLS